MYLPVFLLGASFGQLAELDYRQLAAEFWQFFFGRFQLEEIRLQLMCL